MTMEREIKTLRRVKHILSRLLETSDLEDATESVDRALDQVNYALEDLDTAEVLPETETYTEQNE